MFPPADVEFDDFTDDIELNRLIKAAIWRFRKMRIRSGTARRSLQRFDASLADVEHVDYDRRRVPTVSYNRLNQHYRPAVELSRMILKSESIELESGDSTATSFFVDMNVVFENFVVVALREVLRLPTGVFPQNAQGKLFHLDRNRQVSLEPDLSWWDGGTCRFVGDVKYKPNVKGSDLYQLLAYVASADLPGGLLIYPEGEARPVRHEVRHLGRELRVMTINPQGTEEEILEEVKRVAVVIRRLRAAAIGEARAA